MIDAANGVGEARIIATMVFAIVPAYILFMWGIDLISGFFKWNESADDS